MNDAKATGHYFVKEMFNNVSGSDLVALALHDLLLSESDRHHGNVHIDENSDMRLIDNDSALGFGHGHRLWSRVCGQTSVPTSNTVPIQIPNFCIS